MTSTRLFRLCWRVGAAPGGETAEEQRRYNNRWMFTPATVLSAVDPEAGVVLIRTKDSEVHRRVRCSGVVFIRRVILSIQ